MCPSTDTPIADTRSAGFARKRLHGRDGFTLIETLVAFSVMALLMSVLFRGVVQMRAGSNAFAARTVDEFVAHAVLDDALANRELRAGSYSGRRDGRHWTLVAKPVDLTGQIAAMSDAAPGAMSVPTPMPPKASSLWSPQRLIVRVETTGRPLEIETIRLAMAARP